VIRDIGRWRRKIENHAFGQLTPHGHLTHCAHHHPVAVVALLWIKIIAFALFHAVAILHGKHFRLGKATFNEVRKQTYRSLLCGSPIQYFSGEKTANRSLVQNKDPGSMRPPAGSLPVRLRAAL
jgi:hypothetical protein